MAEIFEIDGDAADALTAAEHALERGECIVFPTDTVYGLGARPDLPEATDRLFEIKERSRDLTIPVLVAGTADVAAIAELDDRAMRLAHEFWPGGLTLVLRRTPGSRPWDLGAARETIGVRVPADALALALLASTGPLAVTSANISGERTPPTCDGVRAMLGDRVGLYICGGPSAGETPSTVIEVIGEEPRILRAGAIPPDDVFAVLRN